MKFVRLVEKTKKYAEKYDGVILKQTKTEIEGIFQGPEVKDGIRKQRFSLEDYTIEESNKENVLGHFKLALLSEEKELLDAEFNLEDAKEGLRKTKTSFGEVFKSETKLKGKCE